MLKKITKLLGIGLTVAMITSLMAVAVPIAALSQPQVTFPLASDHQISMNNADYTIIFSVNKELVATDVITISFPAGTTIAAPTATITAGPGWITPGPTYGGPTFTAVGGGGVWAVVAATNSITYTLAATENIGESAQVRIAVTAGITNPAAIGDYTLTVATSKELTPVASNAYSITAPVVAPLTGVVTVKNPAGVIMAQFTGANAITLGLAIANTPGSVLEVSNGTYVESPVLVAGVNDGITVKATGDAAIVKGVWTINTAAVVAGAPTDTVIDGLKLYPVAAGAPVIVISATANNTMVKNCNISKFQTVAGQVAGTLVNVGAANPSNHFATFMNCTFDTTDGAVADNAIQVFDGPVTIDSSTFMLDASAIFTNDVGVLVAATGADIKSVTVKNSTFTGSSGVGVMDSVPVNPTTVTITGSTFDMLANAVVMNSPAGKLSLTSNTIKNSTVAPGATVDTATAAIDLMDNNTVSMQKNMIEDNKGLAVMVGATNSNVGGITFIGNTLMGNTFGSVNKKTTVTLMAELNYWGAASGPTNVTNPGGAGDMVVAAAPGKYGTIDFMPWSNTSTTEVSAGNTVPANGTVDKSTTVGVTYSSTNTLAATAGVALMKYSGNPAPVATPAPALDGGFYDVYSPNASIAGGTATLLFYNSHVDSDTKAYYYSMLQKEWVKCTTQAVAGNGAYVYVTVNNVSSPSLTELNGTVFALVKSKTIPNPPAINTPSIGATDVSIEPMFTWGAVTGAVRYELSVADDPSFTFLTFSHNVEGITFYKADAANEEALSYDTTYYWRVRAILDNTFAASTPATAYTVGIFTTMAEPSTTGGQVIEVNPTTPQVNVDIPPTQITVEPSGSSIPTYILWIIVVIGAILIIALIVLIVRTRRVA